MAPKSSIPRLFPSTTILLLEYHLPSINTLLDMEIASLGSNKRRHETTFARVETKTDRDLPISTECLRT